MARGVVIQGQAALGWNRFVDFLLAERLSFAGRFDGEEAEHVFDGVIRRADGFNATVLEEDLVGRWFAHEAAWVSRSAAPSMDFTAATSMILLE